MNWDLLVFVNYNQNLRFRNLNVVFQGTGTCVYPSSAAPTNVPALTIPPATPTGVPSSTIPPATTSSSGATGTPYGFPGSGYATSVVHSESAVSSSMHPLDQLFNQ